MEHIVVTGSLAFDYIMDFPQTFEENILPDKLKTLSVSFLAQNFSKNFGGVAGNISYNLGLLHTPSILLASAGAKDFGQYRTHLRKVGVDVAKANIVKNEFSANMFMITDKKNCQIAGFYPGAMAQDATLSLDTIKNIDFLVVSPTVPQAMDAFVKEGMKRNIPFLYDPAQQIPRLSKKQLIDGVSNAAVLIGNDYELALIAKKTGLTKKDFLAHNRIVITTLGEKGSIVERGGEKIQVGIAKPKTIVDPTGAGDAYIGGFIKGFMENQPLRTCGQMGATLASFAIETYGTQKHAPSYKAFQSRYKQAFKSVLE